MGKFVDSPMDNSDFNPGTIPNGSAGVYDGDDCPPFSEYKRTPSPNAVKEKVKLGGKYEKPSGESDQF